VRSKHALAAELHKLYEQRYRRFLRLATAVLRHEADAHDAVQEGFARALKGLGSYSGEGSLEAWTWRIVLNAALAARRRSLGDSTPEGPDPAPVFHDQEADEHGVRRWIAALPERQRLAVFLRYYADLDYQTIGSVLGIEVGTVSATLSAAHAALRRSLEEVAQS
jgi:RNA polymerase sigma-70 factor (ECF subfamily)